MVQNLPPPRSHPAVSDASQEASQDRRARILDAAERCFVRAGFHRTTMQDVAAEAGMSPGNLYRYFPSKDAIVAGLAERDRARVMADFSHLGEADDFIAGVAALARKHFADEPREQAVLCLEIWAEATRNAAFKELTDGFDRDVFGRLSALFRAAQERGAIAPTVDPEALATVIATFANGLFVRRAVSRTFDAEREVGYLLAVIEAAFAGRIRFESGTTGRSAGSLS
ncbi:MAG TPA: TetR/AcrR family transcriptional regulator [Microvirga sp.]|nr:TetR/AcrR family transcriptional regulator [Microvirga sp.]